ncbi:DinB family protein [Metabacillus fastidiosus]|uniref:DinB family protein n=1 Tax=Metabacillus fastidiosus TaxID=1458 RepID=UPI003D27D249
MSTNRELSISNYLQTVIKLRKSVELLPEELITWKPAQDKWSIHEIVIHLIDSNIVNSYRIRKIVSEPATSLATFAHEDWVRHQRLIDAPIFELLDTYETITSYNALMLKSFEESDWLKYGYKGEVEISIAHIVDQFICNHVDIHLSQIERNRTAYFAS